MSVYWVNKVCSLTQTDLKFREMMRTTPAQALADFPLTAEEREAFLSRDMVALYKLGAHGFLLSRLARFECLGLTRDAYNDQLWTLRGTRWDFKEQGS